MSESTISDDAPSDDGELVVSLDAAAGNESGASTLVGREEIPGAPYPQWIERLGLIAAIIAAVLLCKWLWADSGLDNNLLWPISVCGLPIATLLVAEIFGRTVTQIHNTRNIKK